jgi:predicted metal-dependent HD superfamily phosphohydrolase
MAKTDPDIVRLAGQHVFELFSGASADVPLIYHGFKRSRALVDDTRDIAKGNKLNGEQGQVLLLSAWFHDAGEAATKDGSPEQNREKSIEIARAFLESQGQPETVADAVAACLGAVHGGDNAHNALATDVLHDALLAPLAGKNYLEEAELLRLEEQRRTGNVYSDLEWTQKQIDYLHKHTYRTRWAQLEYEGGRARNLGRLYKVLRKQEGEASEQQAEESKVSKTLGRTAESLFADLTRNQLKVLSIADRRTSTMIHVNAIMISLLVALVLRKIEEHRNLIVPTIVLLCVNLAVVFVSIYSMRAGRELRRFRDRDEVPVHEANLLVTTNDAGVSLPEYLTRMNALVSDPPALQKTLFEYLYFGRNLLIHRNKMLHITYDIFIYGLAASLVLFTVLTFVPMK